MKKKKTIVSDEKTIHDIIKETPFSELKGRPWDQAEIVQGVLNPTPYQEKLSIELYERFDKLKAARQNVGKIGNIEDVWNRAEEYVTSYVEEGDEDSVEDDERTNLFIPLTHATVDSILSEWIRQHTTGRVVATDDEEDEPKARLIDMIVRYIERINNIELVDLDSHYNMLVYGNCAQNIYYCEGKRLIRKPTKVNSDGTIEYTEEIISDFSNIKIDDVDLREIYPDDCARKPDFSDSGDMVRRQLIPMSQFQIEYGYHPNAKFVKTIGDTEENAFYTRPSGVSIDMVEVLTWTNKRKDFKRIGANGIILSDTPIPEDHKEIPYAGAGDIKRPRNFWWIGEPELMRFLQEEVNGHRNIRGDAAKMSVLSPIFASSQSKLEEDEIIVEAGKIYYYNGNTPPIQMQVGANFNVSYQEEDRLKDDITTTTGVDRRPESTGPDEVATSIVAKREATLKRIAKKIYHNQLMLEKRRGWLILSLLLQYYKLPKLEKIVGTKNIEWYKKQSEKYVVDMDSKNADGESEPEIYEKKYRTISVPNKDIRVKPELDNKGKVKGMKLNIREKDGYTFFKADPRILDGKFDYDVVADIDIPITKAQEIEMSNQMYDRLKDDPVINSPDGKMYTPDGNSYPIPRGRTKLTETLLKKNGYAAEDFLPDEAQNDSMIDQAMKENMAIMKGMNFGPTPLASPDHTLMHSKFMDKNVDDSMPEVMEIFNAHIQGELDFQEKIAKEMQMKGAGNGGQI